MSEIFGSTMRDCENDVRPSVGARTPEGADEQGNPGWVYFIRGQYSSRHVLIKVGWSKGDPHKRLKELQTGSPVELELLGAVPGSRKDEKEYHAKWAVDRWQGEWFALNGDMVELLTVHGEMVCPEIDHARQRRALIDRHGVNQ